MKFYHVIMCHYIILLYVLQFIVDTEVVTVSILNENIQLLFINDGITVDVRVHLIPVM